MQRIEVEVSKGDPVPQGQNDSSPAIYCWVGLNETSPSR